LARKRLNEHTINVIIWLMKHQPNDGREERSEWRDPELVELRSA
jgi:hypothetical protein